MHFPIKKFLVVLVVLGLTSCKLESDDNRKNNHDQSESVSDSGMNDTENSKKTLSLIRERGKVVCGISRILQGFSSVDNGKWTGLDTDFCRAVAAAVLGSPDEVEYVSLSANPLEKNLSQVALGGVDILVGAPMWEITRNFADQAEIVVVNFYDDQGFMMHVSHDIINVKQMDKASICVRSGSMEEIRVTDYFRRHRMGLELLTFNSTSEMFAAYRASQCKAVTGQLSDLAMERLKISSNPAEHVIFPGNIAINPFGVAVKHKDPEWSNVVKWVHFAMIQAEEMEITSKNIDSLRAFRSLRGLFGTGGIPSKQLPLKTDWAYVVIKTIGNYGEVFYKNLGNGSAMRLDRYQNDVWSKGGLHYAPSSL